MLKFSPSKIFYTTLGLVIGAAIVTGIFYFSLNRTPKTTATNPTNSKSFNLVLTQVPTDGSSTATSSAKIAGTTGTEAVIVINGGANDSIIQTAGGKFETTYPLTEGENTLTITAFDQNTGTAKVITRSILYLTALKGL